MNMLLKQTFTASILATMVATAAKLRLLKLRQLLLNVLLMA